MLTGKTKLYIALAIVAILIIGVVIGVLGSVFLGVKLLTLDSTEQPLSNQVVDSQPTNTETILPPPPAIISAVDVTKKYKSEDLQVNWQNTAERISDTEADRILKLVDPENKYASNLRQLASSNGVSLNNEDIFTTEPVGIEHLVLFKAGTFSDKSSIKNKQLYYWFTPSVAGGPGYDPYDRFLVFIDNDGKLANLLAPKENNDSFVQTADSFGLITSFIYRKFPEITAPKSFTYKTKDAKFSFAGWVDRNSGWNAPQDNALGIASGAELIDPKRFSNNPPMIEPVTEKDYLFTADEGYKVYLKNGCYRLRFPNGAEAAYDIIPSFATGGEQVISGITYLNEKEFKPNIVWQRIANNVDKYMMYLHVSSCGYKAQCSAVVNEAKWFNVDNLKEIGKTRTGDVLYELSDKATNEYYRGLYDFGYEGYIYSTLSQEQRDVYYSSNLGDDSTKGEGRYTTKAYREFLDDQPIFFWKDPFGNYYAFRKAKYQSLAECGKPVIYLYPEKEMDISVSVAPNGGFKKTEPAYGTNGWTVRATPESDLFNYADQTIYPYLFWEGRAYDMTMPEVGFVLKRDKVGEKMSIILGKLGLNSKEIKDFLEFWQPKLEVKPYVFVTFISQAEFDKLAPLTVTPKPDKVIRVFMDYAPLDNPVTVRPLLIKTPVRTGFTVVEWGGRLHE